VAKQTDVEKPMKTNSTTATITAKNNKVQSTVSESVRDEPSASQRDRSTHSLERNYGIQQVESQFNHYQINHYPLELTMILI
jgi:hypothetical protein